MKIIISIILSVFACIANLAYAHDKSSSCFEPIDNLVFCNADTIVIAKKALIETLHSDDKEGTSLATFYAMSDEAIVNKYWKLKQLNGKTEEMPANQEREQYFILRSDGTFSGFAGCNHFNGTFVLNDKDRINFNTNAAATLKSCPDVLVDEHAFLQLFNGICNFSIKEDTLIFNNTTQNSKAVFEAVYF